MNKECYQCEFHNPYYCTCNCFPSEKWILCPIENQKPKNILKSAEQDMQDALQWEQKMHEKERWL